MGISNESGKVRCSCPCSVTELASGGFTRVCGADTDEYALSQSAEDLFDMTS